MATSQPTILVRIKEKSAKADIRTIPLLTWFMRSTGWRNRQGPIRIIDSLACACYCSDATMFCMHVSGHRPPGERIRQQQKKKLVKKPTIERYYASIRRMKIGDLISLGRLVRFRFSQAMGKSQGNTIGTSVCFYSSPKQSMYVRWGDIDIAASG